MRVRLPCMNHSLPDLHEVHSFCRDSRATLAEGTQCNRQQSDLSGRLDRDRFPEQRGPITPISKLACGICFITRQMNRCNDCVEISRDITSLAASRIQKAKATMRPSRNFTFCLSSVLFDKQNGRSRLMSWPTSLLTATGIRCFYRSITATSG